jgi:hypothetical protein
MDPCHTSVQLQYNDTIPNFALSWKRIVAPQHPLLQDIDAIPPLHSEREMDHCYTSAKLQYIDNIPSCTLNGKWIVAPRHPLCRTPTPSPVVLCHTSAPNQLKSAMHRHHRLLCSLPRKQSPFIGNDFLPPLALQSFWYTGENGTRLPGNVTVFHSNIMLLTSLRFTQQATHNPYTAPLPQVMAKFLFHHPCHVLHRVWLNKTYGGNRQSESSDEGSRDAGTCTASLQPGLLHILPGACPGFKPISVCWP